MFLDNTATQQQLEQLMVAGQRNDPSKVTRTSLDRPSAGPALVTAIGGTELLDSTTEWKELLRAPSANNGGGQSAHGASEGGFALNSPHQKSEREGNTQC